MLNRYVALFDAIIKFDLRVKHHLINVVSKELTDLAMDMVDREMQTVRVGSISSY